MNSFSTPVRRTGLIVGLAISALALAAPTAVAGAAGPDIEQVALVNGTNAQHEFKSKMNGTAQVTSATGSYVVFSTDAPLVPEDTNTVDDVYLRSRIDGTTVLVSRTADGEPGNDYSFEPTISKNGRFVAYSTFATNLAKGTGGENLDVVVRDLQGGTTLVSRGADGKPGTKNSFFPVISGNGKHVSFQSFSRLGPKDEDKLEDVYVRNLVDGKTKQVSLLPLSSKDVRSNVLNGDVSDNGRHITFGNDTTLWVRDMKAGQTTRVHREPPTAACSFGAAGSAGRPAISGDGRQVAFASCSEDLVGSSDVAQIFTVDLVEHTLGQVTDGDGHSYHPSFSSDGRYLAFGSEATDLVAGDTEGQPDVFRKDIHQALIVRVSEDNGVGGNNWSGRQSVAISGDGHSVVFNSYAQNLVEGDAFDWEETFFWHD